MTRTQLKALFYFLLRQSSTNTEVSDTNLNTILDNAYQKAIEDICPEYLNTTTVYTIPQTTFASRTNATTVVLTSGTSFATNTDVVIWQGSRYETLRCTNVSTNTLTVSSPGLVYTGFTAATAKVTPVSLVVSDARDIIGVNWEYNTTSKRENYNMHPMRYMDFIEYCSLMKSTGTPSTYGFKTETEMMIYPIPDVAGYLYMNYKNKTAYTLSADETSVAGIDADGQMALVYWALYLTALRNRDDREIQGWLMQYNFTVENARKRIRNRKNGNHGWNLKLSSPEKRA